MHLKCKDWRRFWRKQRLQKCPNGHVIAIIARLPKTRIFWKSAKGRRREIFQKLPKKKPWLQRAKSTLAQMSLSSNLYPLIVQTREKILARKAAPKVLEWPSYGNFWQGHPKPAFSENVQRADQGKFFKNRPKSSFCMKGPKALWRKWHYPLSSTHLKCKDWRTFWFKQRLQKFPNGQVMGIFARSFKTRIFWKSAKGGPKEIFQKSPKK